MESSNSNKKIKFIVGSVLIVLAIGYLISAGVSNTSKYFLTVDELSAQGASFYGTGVKVKGKVVAGSIERNPGNYLDVAFKIEEKNSNIKVVYKGVTPDMFADGRDVVVEGVLAKDGVFHANTLLTSCPSKYEPGKEPGKNPGSMPDYGSDKKPDFKKSDSLPKTEI